MRDYVKVRHGFFSSRKVVIVIDVPWMQTEMQISEKTVQNHLRRGIGRIVRCIMDRIYEPICDGIRKN